MLYQISVRTPKNQADKCMKTQKEALLGLSQARKIVDQKVISHNEFYWVIQVDSEKDLFELTKKCAKGEVAIRRFYRAIFNIFNKANKLCQKFKEGTEWAKKWINKQLNKKFQDAENIKNYIDSMSNEEFQEFLVITDKEEIEELISGDMITLKEYQ